MGKTPTALWEKLREHATHWVIGGVLLAATVFAPEEWLARTMHGLRIPESVLHLWDAGLVIRVVPIGSGVAFIVGKLLWRQRHLRIASVNPATIITEPALSGWQG